MTTVDDNRLKGNFAEYVVASWLSRVALVRPVSTGTDIGIDYYCESILDGNPYLHFWMQVKAIPPSNVINEHDKQVAWFDFETKHLRYWLRQPIPVYAILVPLENLSATFPTQIYGVRVTNHLIQHEIPDQTTVRIKTPDFWGTDSIETDLRQFITEIVPWDTAALLIQKGMIAPIPDGQNDPYKSFPSGIGFRHLHKILDNIRDSSIMGLLDSMAAEKFNFTYRPMRKRFEAIAELFKNEQENLGLSILFRAAIVDGDKDKARSYLALIEAKLSTDIELGSQAYRDQLAAIEEMRSEVS